MKLEFLNEFNDCDYPVGIYYSDNIGYVRAIADKIYEGASSMNRDVCLIVRGTSGCILAGAVGVILKDKGIDTTIIVSRKTESLHGMNMDGVFRMPLCFNVVIDDFIHSGNTLECILNDIDNYTIGKYESTLHMLCVSNRLNDEWITDFIKSKYPNAYVNLHRFETVVCNKR